MARNSIPRKSTWIDMTPFVDVAFLILTFFILATEFKPEEAVQVETPSSVSSRELELKNNTFIILMDKTGGVFVQLAGNLRKPVIDNMNSTRKLNMGDKEIKNFIKTGAIGTPIAGLKQFYSLDDAQRGKLNKGIPIDSIGGELDIWIRDVNSFTQGKAQWFIKGDNAAKYPEFKNVLGALKKNDIYKFNLITTAEPVPAGTSLSESQNKSKK